MQSVLSHLLVTVAQSLMTQSRHDFCVAHMCVADPDVFRLQVGAFPPAVMHRSEYPEAKVKKLYMQALRLVRSPHDRPFAVQISWR